MLFTSRYTSSRQYHCSAVLSRNTHPYWARAKDDHYHTGSEESSSWFLARFESADQASFAKDTQFSLIRPREILNCDESLMAISDHQMLKISGLKSKRFKDAYGPYMRYNNMYMNAASTRHAGLMFYMRYLCEDRHGMLGTGSMSSLPFGLQYYSKD